MATTPVMPTPAGAPGGGGFLSSIGSAIQGLLRTDPGPQLRPVPGQSDNPQATDLYERLAAQDPTADTELKRVYGDVRRDSLKGREIWERSWWKRLLYVNGRQWIKYNSRNGWQDKRIARWIPRPVTNICGSTITTIKAMLAAIDLGLRARPNGPDTEATIAAEAIDTVEPAIREEHEISERMAEADFWAAAVGNVWLHVYWDPDSEKHQEFIQAMQCPECGYKAHPLDISEGTLQGCPTCGLPANQFVPAQGPDGKPFGQSYSTGGAETRVVSPLELLFPQYFQNWRDVDRLIYLRWRPRSYYEGTPYENLINFGNTPGEQTLQMYRQLATMSDLTTPNIMGGRQGGATNDKGEGCIEAELWIKPNTKYPKGLWARLAGGKAGDAVIVRLPDKNIMPGPLPYKNPSGKVIWPWIHYSYEFVGGRIYAKGAIDGVLGKQDAINRGDSMTELTMQRTSNPIWLEPKGAEVQRLTGEPGLIVRYQTVAGSNAKPERVEGMNPVQATFALRVQHFEDAERLAGTQDVLKGMKPAGVEAFSALNLLVERSQSMFTSLFKSRGRAYRDWFIVALEIERSYGPKERLIAATGKGNIYTFKKILQADIQGSVTIVIEDGSDTPKTSLGRRAAIQQLQQLGVDLSSDPDMVYQVMLALGVPEIAPTLDAQSRAAQVALQMYDEWLDAGRPGGPPANPLQVWPWQNHKIFIAQLDRWASSDRVRMLVMQDPHALAEIRTYRMLQIVADQNPFGEPQPIDPMSPGGMAMGGGAPGGPPPGPGGPGAPGPGGPQPAVGAARAMQNSNQESGAVDTLPGAAPGGGGMGAPA